MSPRTDPRLRSTSTFAAFVREYGLAITILSYAAAALIAVGAAVFFAWVIATKGTR